MKYQKPRPIKVTKHQLGETIVYTPSYAPTFLDDILGIAKGFGNWAGSAAKTGARVISQAVPTTLSRIGGTALMALTPQEVADGTITGRPVFDTSRILAKYPDGTYGTVNLDDVVVTPHSNAIQMTMTEAQEARHVRNKERWKEIKNKISRAEQAEAQRDSIMNINKKLQQKLNEEKQKKKSGNDNQKEPGNDKKWPWWGKALAVGAGISAPLVLPHYLTSISKEWKKAFSDDENNNNTGSRDTGSNNNSSQSNSNNNSLQSNDSQNAEKDSVKIEWDNFDWE